MLSVVQDTVEYGIDHTYEDAWSFPKIPSHTSWRKITNTSFTEEDLKGLTNGFNR